MITTVEAAIATQSAGRVRGTDESYATLKALVAGRGLLERCPRAQLRPAAGHLALFATTVAGVALMRGSWWALLWTLPAALLFGQLGFLAHDAAHNQILRTSRANYALSVALFNLCLGGSRGWWAERHTTHHAQPNRAGIDPDIEGGVVAVWSGQARQARGFTRFMIGQQAKTIVPLVTLSALQMRAYSAGFLRNRGLRNPRAELALMLVHYAVYVGGPVAMLGVGRGAGLRGRAPAAARHLPRRRVPAQPHRDGGAR